MKLFKLIFSKPLFAKVFLAFFISGIGTAFTSVAVYEALAKQDYGPLGFALAFIAGVAPGVLTSWWAGGRYLSWSFGKVLVFAQSFGLIMLIFPLISTFTNSVGWLLMAEVTASAVGGLLLPIYKTIEKSSFSDEELPHLAVVDTFLLTANFICGQGLGSLLVSVISLRAFLFVNCLTYVLSILILIPLVKKLMEIKPKSENQQQPTFFYQSLSSEQKKGIWLLPWLALTCAPLMVLLPSRSDEFQSVNFGLLLMTPALFLICSRTIGQLIGPFLASKISIQKLNSKHWSLNAALFVYILFYSGAYLSSSIYVAAAFCILAHVCSNVVYSVGNYRLMKVFDSSQVGWAFGHVYRVSTVVISISALLGGVIAEHLGLTFTLILSFIFWSVGAMWFATGKTEEIFSEEVTYESN